MPANLSPFLTLWFCFDAVLNGFCAFLFAFVPHLFYEGIGGPLGDDVTPNLIFTARTQATYFAIAAGCMLTAAASTCARTRRRLALCFVLPGVVIQTPSILVRMGQEDGGWTVTWVLQLLSCVVIVAPYIWYGAVQPEDEHGQEDNVVENAPLLGND